MTYECCGGTFWLYLAISFCLVCFAGCMSGLTLGLMSLSTVDLEVLAKSGEERNKFYAAKIIPLVKNQHLLLVTLLLGNALAAEALPIFLDGILPSWGSILVSVTLILVFGEILPQALCSRFGLLIGARAAPFVRVLIMLFYPFTYPVSKLLDYLLGHKNAGIFRRAELSAYVNMHAETAGKGGELSIDETTIITGALDMTSKSVEDAMTPVKSVYSLEINTKLDRETMSEMMLKGHSRVPVYSGQPANIIGLVLVKNLLNIKPEDNLCIKNVTIRKLPRVSFSLPLYDMLNEFQKGQSHMAAVVRKKTKESDPVTHPVTHLVTHTVASANPDPVPHTQGDKGSDGLSNLNRSNSARHDCCCTRNLPTQTSRSATSSPLHPHKAGPGGLGEGGSHHGSTTALERLKRGAAGSSSLRSKGAGMGMGMGMEEGHGSGKGWRGKRNVLSQDESNLQNVVPFFPEDEEILGLITLEDVIEELLQEEILDETDDYVSVHHKIQVGSVSKNTTFTAPPMLESRPRNLSQTVPHCESFSDGVVGDEIV